MMYLAVQNGHLTTVVVETMATSYDTSTRRPNNESTHSKADCKKEKKKQTTNEVTKTMVRVTAIAVVAPTQQLGANQYTSGEWVGGCRGLAAPGSSGGTAVQ